MLTPLRRSFRAAGTVVLLAAPGCSHDPIDWGDAFTCQGNEYRNPSGFEFAEKSVALKVGESRWVFPTPVDSRGRSILCYPDLTHSSTNPAIAKVVGIDVTGIAPGSAFVKVAYGAVADSIPVIVSAAE